MGAEFTVDIDSLTGFLDQIAASDRDPRPGLESAREEMTLRVHDRWMAGVAPDGTPWPSSARALGVGGQTLINTSRLMRSVQFDVEDNGLVQYSDDRRMRAHQEGLTITPKNGMFLAIPMTDAVAKQYQAGVSIRDQWPKAFVLRSSGGHVFLVQHTDGYDKAVAKAFQTGKRGKRVDTMTRLEFLFELVSEVHEPKREGVGYSEGDLEMIGEQMLRHLGIEH